VTVKRRYPRFAQDFSGESKTQQHFADECDVNNIVAQYDRTGIDPYAENKNSERYGDGMYRTYSDAMLVAAEMRSNFEELPAAVRAQYDFNVENYLKAVDARAEAELAPSLEEQQEAPSAPPEPPPEDANTLDRGGE